MVSGKLQLTSYACATRWNSCLASGSGFLSCAWNRHDGRHRRAQFELLGTVIACSTACN